MKFVLMQESRPIGTVSCEISAIRVTITAVCDRVLEGIWRAYLICDEREFLIGVLSPNAEGRFSARKQYSKSEFNGVQFEACRCEIRHGSAHRQWFPCKDPASLFQDSAMQSALCCAEGVLIDRESAPTRVAVPLDSGCACAPALCLAHYMEYQGKAYAVLSIHSFDREQTENSSV